MKRLVLLVVSLMLMPILFAQNGMNYVELSQNRSFNSQINQINTIYEIRHNFDLGGASVKIPDGCILKFEGGSLSNGAVNFNGCSVDANDNHHIFNNITDFYNLRECSVKWFGAKGDGVNDDTPVFRYVLDRDHDKGDVTKHFVVRIPHGMYLITDCVNPGAYTNESFTHVEIIGEEGAPVSQYDVIEEIRGAGRSLIYCMGNLKGKPYIYATSLIKHISFRGEDNNNRSNYKTFLPKYYETLAISISRQGDYATYRRLEDVQVHFFGTGIEEMDSFGGDWSDVEVCCNGYGVKIVPQRSNITMQTITGLHIAKSKYDGLLINPKAPYRCLIHFENLICEHADVQNNPERPNKETYYNIRSNTSISINNGYCENAYNNSDIANMLLTGGEGALYTITNFRFLSGTYNFYAPIVIIGSAKSFSARFNMHSFHSNIMNVYIESLEGYDKTILHNVTVSNKQAVVEKPFASFSTIERPYWNKMNAGEFYYDTDLQQLVYWNGTNWSNLDGVNVSGVTITSVIGDSSKRCSLSLTEKQAGFRYFDTTLQKPLWWGGKNWVDANGNIVE